MQPTLTSLGPGIVYSRLLRLRSGPEDEVPLPSLLLECDLCESWEMVDPWTYRFELRKGVRWQNIPPVNGRELVAEDVVFSYERQRTAGWANAPLLQNMESVEAEGRYTLKITLNRGFPDADFLVSLADGHTKVVAKEAVEVNGDLKEGPVIGSGPWIWKSTQTDIGTVFERNPDYFEDGLPFGDELVARVIKGGEESRLAAFRTGAVNVYRPTPESWNSLQMQSGTEFNSFLYRQGGSGLILTMNVSAPPFDNLQVRKAVLKALDPWNYLRATWADQGFVSLGMPVQRPDWLLTRDQMREVYFADPSGASDILKDSGVQLPIKFELAVADFGDIHLRQGRQIEEDLRSVGFDPTSRILNPTQFTDKVWHNKDYQLSIGALPPTTTTNGFLFSILHGASGLRSVIAHSDSRLDDMIVEQAVEGDATKRGEMVRDIQTYLLDQAYLFSPVTEGSRWVFAPGVKGFYPNTAASEYFFWAKAWIE